MLRIDDLVRISWLQVVRRHKRYMGVLLSIAFGVSGLIVILTMGREVKTNLNKDLELLGGVTVIKVGFEGGSTAQDRIMRAAWFQESSAEAVRAIPGVQATSLLTLNHSVAAIDKRSAPLILYGVDEHFWEVNGIKPMHGEFFDETAVDARSQVCVLGEEVAKKFFGVTDVVGRQMSINNQLFKIVGVLEAGNMRERAEWGYVPITTQRDRIQATENELPVRMYVRSRTLDDVPRIAEMLPRVIESAQSAPGLKVDVAWDQLNHVKRIIYWVELFIYAAVIATLVLGGFGIWNGMMTAVKARTREIGLKKAMGAEDVDILIQFLSESLWLSLIADFIGIAIGYAGVELATRLLKTQPPPHLFLMYAGMSIIFAMVLGVLAGFYPALRASRMEVVNAIRYE